MKAAGWFTKFEGLVPPQDGGSLSERTTPSTHGTSGPIKVTASNYEYGVDKDLLAAIPQVPGITFSKFGFIVFVIQKADSCVWKSRSRYQLGESSWAGLCTSRDGRRHPFIRSDRT